MTANINNTTHLIVFLIREITIGIGDKQEQKNLVYAQSLLFSKGLLSLKTPANDYITVEQGVNLRLCWVLSLRYRA